MARLLKDEELWCLEFMSEGHQSSDVSTFATFDADSAASSTGGSSCVTPPGDAFHHAPFPTKLLASTGPTKRSGDKLGHARLGAGTTEPALNRNFTQQVPTGAPRKPDVDEQFLLPSGCTVMAPGQHRRSWSVDEPEQLQELLAALTALTMHSRPEQQVRPTGPDRSGDTAGHKVPMPTAGSDRIAPSLVAPTTGPVKDEAKRPAKANSAVPAVPAPPTPAQGTKELRAQVAAEKRQNMFSKTEMCRFNTVGKCSKGADCRFAHGVVDLQVLPDLTKTSICHKWARRQCPFSDEECRYAHGNEDRRPVVKEPASKHGSMRNRRRQ